MLGRPEQALSVDEDPRPLAAKTVIGAAWLLTWRVFTRSLGVVSTLVLARVLVPADFGIVAMAATFAAAVDSLSQLGLQDALVRHVGDDRRLFDTAFTLQVGRACITSAIVAAAAPTADWWFNEPKLGPVLLVLAASSLVGGFENVGIVEFRRRMRFDMQFRILVIPRVLQVAVTIPMALLLHSYWALLIGIVVAQVGRVIMGYVVHPYRPWFRLSGWQELASFSFWTWASCAASLVWDRLDPFILGPKLGPARLGLYLLAVELAILPVTEVVAPVSDALFAGFASAQKKGEGSLYHAPLVAATLVMAIMPITITISCGSGYVAAALLGPKWVGANGLIAILAWLCLFSPISFVCNAVLVANGYVRRNFMGKVIASAVKLAVMITAVALTDRLDFIAGAVTTCVVAESIAFLLLLRGIGNISLSIMPAALARSLTAGTFVVVVMELTGIAWRPVEMPSVRAAIYLSGIGVTVTTLYVIILATAWYLAGRPAGPETKLVDALRSFLRPLALRLLGLALP